MKTTILIWLGEIMKKKTILLILILLLVFLLEQHYNNEFKLFSGIFSGILTTCIIYFFIELRINEINRAEEIKKRKSVYQEIMDKINNHIFFFNSIVNFADKKTEKESPYNLLEQNVIDFIVNNHSSNHGILSGEKNLQQIIKNEMINFIDELLECKNHYVEYIEDDILMFIKEIRQSEIYRNRSYEFLKKTYLKIVWTSETIEEYIKLLINLRQGIKEKKVKFKLFFDEDRISSELEKVHKEMRRRQLWNRFHYEQSPEYEEYILEEEKREEDRAYLEEQERNDPNYWERMEKEAEDYEDHIEWLEKEFENWLKKNNLTL